MRSGGLPERRRAFLAAVVLVATAACGMSDATTRPEIRPTPSDVVVRKVERAGSAATSMPTSASPSPWTSTARRAHIELPDRADAPFTVTDVASGVRTRIRLLGAESVTSSSSSAEVRSFDGAYRGGAWSLVTSLEGVEDAIAFPERPGSAEVRYLVDVTGVRGVRMARGTRVVEFLDERGHPRLRMAAPHVEDAKGSRIAASVDVEGCAFDRDASPPWNRAPVRPDSDQCTIVVRWPEVAYPAVLDPSWTTTGSLAEGRVFHVATRLPAPRDAEVLVAGGSTTFPNSGTSMTATAEVWNGAPNARVWATTGSLARARYLHDQTVAGATVVAIGGVVSGLVDDPGFEIYDPSTGTWSTGPSMNRPRYSARVSHVRNRTVASGGTGSTASKDDADVYDGSTWTLTSATLGARGEHTQVALADDRVFVAGGVKSGAFATDGALATTALLDVPAGSTSWTPGPNLGDARFRHGAERLADGRVLLFGGVALDPTSSYLSTTELFDPTQGTAGSMARGPDMATAGEGAEHARLSDGRILVGHGLAFTQVYEPAANRWRCAGRSGLDGSNGGAANMTEFAPGLVLMAGNLVANVVSPRTEIWDGNARSRGDTCSCSLPGTATVASAECTSGFCVSGACGCATSLDCTGAPEGDLCDATTHACVTCDGDFGSNARNACPGPDAPACTSGGCVKCTSNEACRTGTHAGPVCDLATGACTNLCAADADCFQGFCPKSDAGAAVCASKATNGKPLPVGLPCDASNALRACASGTCDPADGLCGTTLGGACSSDAVCRSVPCGTDGLCGLPHGAACIDGLQCRAGVCARGFCGLASGEACTSATQCRADRCGSDGACGNVNGQPCSRSAECRNLLCGSDGLCGRADGTSVGDGGAGECRSGVAAGGICGRTDDSYRALRGGGISCRSTSSDLPTSPTSVGAFGVLAVAGLALRRFRRRARELVS
ncbi:MAG: hypothetical protein U0169_01160 [Polyangiaceae bacterium]